MNGGCIDVSINRYTMHTYDGWFIQLYRPSEDPSTMAYYEDFDGNDNRMFQLIGNPRRWYLEIMTPPCRYIAHHPGDIDIHVTQGIVRVDWEDAEAALRLQPVDNMSNTFTSQIWVLDALDTLYDMELIPDDDFERTYDWLADLHQPLAEDMDMA
jgi:hypothetical protein